MPSYQAQTLPGFCRPSARQALMPDDSATRLTLLQADAPLLVNELGSIFHLQ
jgi:hypothetical protein